MAQNMTSVVALFLMLGGTWFSSTPSGGAASRVPIVVELFTSEGCSSCPPADAFLQQLDQQPWAGAQMIVLSEHVDYWNHIGWTDPYSSHFYSNRQNNYAERFHLDGVYTPQMVVDGTSEFTGSNHALADKAFTKALETTKIAVRLSGVALDQTGDLLAHVEIGAEPSIAQSGADVYVAVALGHAESQVSRGENAGRRLQHVAVVRSMVKVGMIQPGQTFSQDVRLKSLKLDSGNLRVVAFVQEPHQGRILGAAQGMVGDSSR